MTILSLLQGALVGKEIEVFQNKEKPDDFYRVNPIRGENTYYLKYYNLVKVVVLGVEYVVSAGPSHGDFFKVVFEGGYIILADY